MSVTITKSTQLPKVKSKSLGISVGELWVTPILFPLFTRLTPCLRVLSTPFTYYPRSRPAAPLPYNLSFNGDGFELHPDWTAFESIMKSKQIGKPDILARFYVPTSRIFYIGQSIPFHLSLQSSAVSLAAFLPLSPTASGKRCATQVQVMRQTTVDVRCVLV